MVCADALVVLDVLEGLHTGKKNLRLNDHSSEK